MHQSGNLKAIDRMLEELEDERLEADKRLRELLGKELLKKIRRRKR